jgi:hypothetical protein
LASMAGHDRHQARVWYRRLHAFGIPTPRP